MKDFRFHLKYILESLQLQDAIIRRVEIIGEATKKIPENFRLIYPQIPWQKMAALRAF